MSGDVISVGKPLPLIAAAAALGGRLVRVEWRSGGTSIVDLAPALQSRRIYIPLRDDDELFATFRVNADGNAIEWDGEMDFSAVWLAHLPSATFGNDEFRAAMETLGMSLPGMAAALEVSRRLVASYRGERPIPRHIAYATRYLLDQHTKASL